MIGSGNSCNQGLLACLPSPNAVEENKVNSKADALVALTKSIAAESIEIEFFETLFETSFVKNPSCNA